MAQVKTKKERVEFNEAMINWTGYKKKMLDVQSHIGAPYISGTFSVDQLMTRLTETFCKAYERALSVLTITYGELSDVKVSWNSGYGTILAKALETEANFKKRVFAEEKYKFNQGKMEEDRKVKQKEKDLKTYEKLKLKYNLP